MTSGAPDPASAPRVGVILVAAGQSSRMAGVDKTFTPVLGIPLVAYSLDQFEAFPPASEVVLVLAEQSLGPGQELVSSREYRKVSHICVGGKRRQDSVRNGLQALQPCDWVIVHDGARPCLDQPLLPRGLDAVQETGAAVAGAPVKDTIKVVSAEEMVADTPDRDSLWAAQTPQFFRYDLLLKAHRSCIRTVTDDAAMVEGLGHPVRMFFGSHHNLKVTTPEDLIVVEALLRERVKDPVQPAFRK